MQVDGEWVYAESYPAGQYGNDLPRATCAVAPGDERPFVQIPIDTDCNWIADSWEKPKAKEAQLGDHFPTRCWDLEIGKPQKRPIVSSGNTKGDGYGAFDEYRGFHVLDGKDNNKVIHRRTNPHTDLDLFVRDLSQDGQYNLAIDQLIADRLDGIVAFHRVNEPQSTIVSSTVAAAFLDENSEKHPLIARAYAIAIKEQSDGPGSTPVAPVYVAPCLDTLLASASKIGKSNQPITFCIDNITRGRVANIGSIHDVEIRAHLVAHELGHRLNLKHYLVEEFFSGVSDPALVGGTPVRTFSTNANNANLLYTWQPRVTINGSLVITDEILWGLGLLVGCVVNPSQPFGQSLPSFQAGTSPDSMSYILWSFESDQQFMFPANVSKLVKWAYTQFLLKKNYFFDPSRLSPIGWDFSKGQVIAQNDIALIDLNKTNP
jgi:hypothetical protein